MNILTQFSSGSKNTRQRQLDSLNLWNKLITAIYVLQGIAILIFSSTHSLSIATQFLTKDELQTKALNSPVFVSASRHLFYINIAFIIAIVLFVLAIIHGIIAVSHRQRYEENLFKGINTYRWIEFSFTFSMVILIIGLFVGIFDSATLISVIALVLLMTGLYLLTDIVNQRKRQTDWLPYILGSMAGIIPLIVIGWYSLMGILFGNSLPSYIYWLVASMFILLICFMAITYLYNKHIGRWSDNIYNEQAFIILSLVINTAFVWQVFAGLLRR